MSFAFSNRLYTSRRLLPNNKMDDITPELYKEVLKYKKQGDNYLTQPIDLASYRYLYRQNVA